MEEQNIKEIEKGLKQNFNISQSEIEKGFQATTALLLGKKLTNLDDYGGWLGKNVRGKVTKRKSKISEKMVCVPSVQSFQLYGDNVVTIFESLKLGETTRLEKNEVDSLSLANASKVLAKIKLTSPEVIYGENIGTEESACYGPSQYCYKVTFCWFSKYIAYTFWARNSDHMYGCSNVASDCGFSIKCYSSTKLTRCFEVNDSHNCSDCYFCHNCEGMSESMFCFNTKGKRYAIGNVELGKEAYMKIKKLVQSQIFSELEKTKQLRYDIYTIGSL